MGTPPDLLNRGPTGCSDRRVQYIVKFIDLSLSNPNLNVERVAGEVHLSPSRVCFLMRNYLGQTPRRYILDKRILRAEVLLTSTFLSIKEIMFAVGMNDPTHFGKEFKKLFGVAPSQYRRNAGLRISA